NRNLELGQARLALTDDSLFCQRCACFGYDECYRYCFAFMDYADDLAGGDTRQCLDKLFDFNRVYKKTTQAQKVPFAGMEDKRLLVECMPEVARPEVSFCID